MRNSLCRFLLSNLILLVSLHSASAGSIRWTNSYTSALAHAKQSNKLIMVDLFTDWCGYCKKLDAETYPDSRVVQAVTQVLPVRMNAEHEGLSIARKYGVSSFPTILFIDRDGDLEDVIVGYLPPDGFVQRVQGCVQSYRAIPALVARYRANPREIDTAAKLVQVYTRKGRLQDAVSVFDHMASADPGNTHSKLTEAAINVGKVYAIKRDFPAAMSYFHKAVKFARYPVDVAVSHWCIALVYLQQKKYQQAVPDLVTTANVNDGSIQVVGQAQQILDTLRQKNLIH